MGGSQHPLKPVDIFTTLQLVITYLETYIGLIPKAISVKYLQSAGSIFILSNEIDNNIFCLIGLWYSDSMPHYLHVYAYLIIRNFVPLTVSHKWYTLHANHKVPAFYTSCPPPPPPVEFPTPFAFDFC